MQQITPHVYIETEFIGCNSTFVVTDDGLVLIDTPESPADAVKWRDIIEQHGKICYVINTEPHGDHFAGNCFYVGTVIAHEGTRDAILKTSLTRVKNNLEHNPANAPYLKEYYLRPPEIVFSEKLTLYCGKHSFHLIHLPGHSPYQIAVYIPEEKVICTSDNVVYKYQPGLHQPLLYEWLKSLDYLASLGDNRLVPGHGKVCDTGYLAEMKDTIQAWIGAVKTAMNRGLSLEEAQNTISFIDQYPIEEGHPLTAVQIQRENVAGVYNALKDIVSGVKNGQG